MTTMCSRVFLQAEIHAWAPVPDWALLPSNEHFTIDPDDQKDASFPARRLVGDLAAVIAAKPAMTRRQWTSLLESVLRLAAVAHVAWTCDVHAKTWSCLRGALDGGGPRDVEETRASVFPRPFQFLSYGDRALPAMKDRASAFLQARLGLNATLWALEAIEPGQHDLSSARGIHGLCDRVRNNASALEKLGLRDILSDVSERETRTLLCKKGIGSNIMEFAATCSASAKRQIQSCEDMTRVSCSRSAAPGTVPPWVVGMGPVAILALVHCSLAGATGPRSVRRLSPTPFCLRNRRGPSRHINQRPWSPVAHAGAGPR